MDTTRLTRAVFLEAHRVGPGRWIVTGGAEPHVVTMAEGGAFACDCRDHAVHGGVVGCKHTLRVRLARADTDVLEALREVVPMPKRARRARVAR